MTEDTSKKGLEIIQEVQDDPNFAVPGIDLAASDLVDQALKNDPRVLGAMVQAEIDSMMNIFESQHPDELIDWIKSTGLSSRQLHDIVHSLKPGQTTVISGRSFVRTVFNTFQDAEAYIRSLERSTIAVTKKMSDFQQTLEKTTKARLALEERFNYLQSFRFYRFLKYLRLLP